MSARNSLNLRRWNIWCLWCDIYGVS